MDHYYFPQWSEFYDTKFQKTIQYSSDRGTWLSSSLSKINQPREMLQ